jgi:hypothetical protein
MDERLRKLEGENEFEYIKRLVYGKLVYKTIKASYEELAVLIFGQELSPVECRKRVYGVKRILDVIENKDEQKNSSFTTIKTEYQNYEQIKTYKDVVEINKDGSYTSDRLIGIEDESKLKDENFLLSVHSYDPKVWEIVSARNSIWNTQIKGGSVTKLYASKINVKPRTEYKWNEEDIQNIFNSLNLESNRKCIVPKQYEKNGRILVVPIADFHYGLVTDIYSNGNDYNLEIADNLFFQVINDVIVNNKGKTFEKVLFVMGNDMTNSDNLSSTTAKGTPQNDCALWFTIVERISNLLVFAIDSLCKIAPVDVVYVPSNHDLHTMFGVTRTINAWYRNDKNVNVDISPLTRKYYKFGKNILAFAHDVKTKEALKIVSTEAKDMWSDSNRVIFMLAHLHQSMIYEKQGMLEVLRLPTISGYSRWTNTQGYVQTERKNQAFVVDYNHGIKETQNTILEL